MLQERVELRARVKGFLNEKHFDEGSNVKKDQLLLVIDEQPFKVRVDQAKAALDQAEAALKKAQQSKAREVAKAPPRFAFAAPSTVSPTTLFRLSGPSLVSRCSEKAGVAEIAEAVARTATNVRICILPSFFRNASSPLANA